VSDLDKILDEYLNKAIKAGQVIDKVINGPEMQLVLEVGSHTIKLIEYVVKSDKIEVISGAVLNTPINSIENDRLVDINVLANMLKQTLNNEKIKTKELVVSVVSKEIIIREMNVPNMKEKDLKNFVRINSNDIFPVKLSNYILGYNIIEKGNSNRVMIAAIPKDILITYIELADKLGLNLKGFNYSGYELYNFLDFEIGTMKSSYLAVDLGAKNTNIVIISNGVLKFNKIIPKGSEETNRYISEELNCNLMKAEQLKRYYNSIEMPEGVILNPEEEAVIKYTRRCVDNILQDIVRIIEFFNSNNTQNKISKIYIIGTAGKIKGIEEYFSKKINIQTIALKNLKKVEFGKQAVKLKSRHQNFINCFGAHSLKEHKFYFIKSELKFKSRSIIMKSKFHKMMLCACLIIIMLLTYKITQIQEIEKNIESYNNYIEKNSDIADLRNRITLKENEYNKAKKDIDALGIGMENYIDIVNKVDDLVKSLKTDAQVSITKYEYSTSNKKDTLEITGTIVLPEGINQISSSYVSYKNLEYELKDGLQKELVDKTVDSSSNTRDGNINFTLTIEIG